MKSVLFNADDVRKVRRASQKVLHRTIRNAPKRKDLAPYYVSVEAADLKVYGLISTTNSRVWRFKPPYLPGEIIYAREPWTTAEKSGQALEPKGDKKYFYKGDFPANDPILGKVAWEPSIQMPKEAARLFLRVTDVDIKRIHIYGVEGDPWAFEISLERCKMPDDWKGRGARAVSV